MYESELLDRIRLATSSETVELLCDAFGGTSVYVPQAPHIGSPLVSVIGVDAVAAIIREIGYGPLWLPMGNKHGCIARKKRVEALIRGGASTIEAARIVRVSENAASRVRCRLIRNGETIPDRRRGPKERPRERVERLLLAGATVEEVARVVRLPEAAVQEVRDDLDREAR